MPASVSLAGIAKMGIEAQSAHKTPVITLFIFFLLVDNLSTILGLIHLYRAIDASGRSKRTFPSQEMAQRTLRKAAESFHLKGLMRAKRENDRVNIHSSVPAFWTAEQKSVLMALPSSASGHVISWSPNYAASKPGSRLYF